MHRRREMATKSSHAWQSLYPPLQAHDHGWLDVGDGHAIYWEVAGNPLGIPALFVHGGPGAGCTADDRRWFDPRCYRIVLFDQRGAGRSRPPGRLLANDTSHLVADMEQLRRHLQVDRWLVFGGSWGATLALAYAQRYPEQVSALVLRGVFTATLQEQEWLYSPNGAAKLRPAAWERLRRAVQCEKSRDLLDALATQLHCGDSAAERAAAGAWLRWEQELMEAEPSPSTPDAMRDPGPVSSGVPALAAARIGVHFARHHFFVPEGRLLADASRLGNCPGVIVQGGADLVTPPAAAASLHRAWPGSQLRLLPSASHSSSHPMLAQHLIAATDFFRDP